MEETIIFPSPNWFQPSGMVASTDGWLFYGGPSKSICVLEPLPQGSDGVIEGNQTYKAHVLNRAHPDKIVCLDISPEWPEKKAILAGSADGTVKQWSLEKSEHSVKLKSTHSHEIHNHEKEEVVGVGYCQNGYAVTVGCYGHIVKWDLNSNVAKSFNNVLKTFKPVCIACSPHVHLNVAIGTKQGVVFVLDLNGAPRVLYKVRGQDDEIMKVSWCPQYEVLVKKALKESENGEKQSIATQRMNQIRQEPETPETMKELEKRVQKYVAEHLSNSESEKVSNIAPQHSQEVSKPETVTSDVPQHGQKVSKPETENSESETVTSDAPQHGQEVSKPETVTSDVPQHGQKVSKPGTENSESETVTSDAPQHGQKVSKPETENSESETVTSDVPQHGQKVSKPETENSESETVTSDIPQYSQEVSKPETESKPKEELDESGIGKTLPNDSFDELVVVEDDMFDIYKEPEDNEFGHKKYQPEMIKVTVSEESQNEDYLAECLKLKEAIMKRKNEPETIESLVEALDRTHVDVGTEEMRPELGGGDATDRNTVDSSAHIHKHLLASIGKHGSVRIWSKSGKLVSSCAVPNAGQKSQRNQRSSPTCATLLWYQPGVLLIADGKSQLLKCDPLTIDCKNKLDWQVVHTLHRRGLYCVASNAPRVQLGADDTQDWWVWTIAQDRNLTCYSLKQQQAVSTYNTCGGFLYNVQPCPYDAKKVAISVGDGAVRVWEADTSEDDTKLLLGQVTTYWQNVQGKVLTVAWHPTRENRLAFSTAESRVGLIDTSGKTEKPAKVLLSALTGGVYSLCWGEGQDLFACGGGELVVYKADHPEGAPTPVRVEHEGQKWEISVVRWYPNAMVVGSNAGAVAVLEPQHPHKLATAVFVFSKMIHTVDWHPQETSSSNEESPYKNLIAVCSLDKVNTIVILEYGSNDDGTKQLATWKTLAGHKAPVLQVSWNPHVEGQLLSTSQDDTVRVWNVAEGVCTSIFSGHSQSALGAAWCALPQHSTRVLSGGADCCLRLWDTTQHPALAYTEKPEAPTKKERKKKENKEKKEEKVREQEAVPTDDQKAAILEKKIKASKRYLLPMIYKQTNPCKINGPRRMLQKYLENTCGIENGAAAEEFDVDYIKLFGNINDVNDVLDAELERHQDTGNMEAWMLLCIFRGQIDAMMQYASQRDMLDPFLVSIAPCVSFKYWKDVTQLYVAQVDRLIAKGEEIKLFDSKYYGGAVYRKVSSLLSLHDVIGAVNVLTDARLFKEAYVLCRTRYMESIAQQTLQLWAQDCIKAGSSAMAAACYIALGNLSQAATVLGKSTDEEFLSLAADLAKVDGQTTLADHIEEKRDQIKLTKEASQKTEEVLEELPSRVELLMKDDKDQKAEDQIETRKEELDMDKTQALLEELPSKMEVLAVDNDKVDTGVVSNGTNDMVDTGVVSNGTNDNMVDTGVVSNGTNDKVDTGVVSNGSEETPDGKV